MVGIDLGTTCSCVAVMDGDAPKVIENLEGMRTTPSYVTFMDDGTKVIGIAAKRYAISHPEDSFYSMKRLLGRQFDDPKAQEFIKKAPYKVIKGPNGECYVQGSTKAYSPSEILGFVLDKMRDTAESHLGTKVKKIVVSIPTTFDEAQKKATKEAAKFANMEVMHMVDEPSAVALAYGLDKSEDKTIGVYDFGGGTFDFDIVQITDGTFEIKSAKGHPYLGGEDFDIAIQDFLIKEFLTTDKIDLSTERLAIQRIREAAENAKMELSTALHSQINLPYIAADATGPKHLNYKLSRAKFESLVSDIIDKSFIVCAEALEEAGIQKEDLSDIILAGGSSKIPKVREAVKKFFDKEPLRDIPPDEAIAMGAALQGGVLTSEISSVDMIEIIPSSLGISFGGKMLKMIEANTIIPARATKIFTTSEDNQKEIEVTVLQGEKELAEQNKVLSVFTLNGIPPAPKGVPRIEVMFDVRRDGHLRVSSRDISTGLTQGVIQRSVSKKKVKK